MHAQISLRVATNLPVSLRNSWHDTAKRDLYDGITNQGNWNVAKTETRKYAKLTDDDLKYTEGQEDELVGRIQKVTGETQETVEHAIEEYSKLPR